MNVYLCGHLRNKRGSTPCLQTSMKTVEKNPAFLPHVCKRRGGRGFTVSVQCTSPRKVFFNIPQKRFIS